MWSEVAVYRPTGTLTSPNVITPVQIARAMTVLLRRLRPGPGTLAPARSRPPRWHHRGGGAR
ncbi:hypothetical protein GCM10010378_48920 [Streptomyces viridochromogenes]